MTEPVPDRLAALVAAVLARLRAALPVAGVPAERVLDAPVDPLPEGRLPAVAVYPVSEDETFPPFGAPAAADAGAELMVLVQTGEQPGWRAQALALRHAVRLALLTDPDFAAAWPPLSCQGRFLFEAAGRTVLGQAALTLRFAYATAYPPVIADDLAELRLGLDAIDPFDPTGAYDPGRPAPRPAGPDGRIEVPAGLTLPTEDA